MLTTYKRLGVKSPLAKIRNASQLVSENFHTARKATYPTKAQRATQQSFSRSLVPSRERAHSVRGAEATVDEAIRRMVGGVDRRIRISSYVNARTNREQVQKA